MPEKERITNKKSLDVYTLKELSELLDMERQTIMKYIDKGELKASRVGNKYFFTRESVLELLKKYEV